MKTTEQLRSSLALRIIDIFGIYTRDMPDIRTLMYKHNNIFSGSYNLSASDKIFFIYKEVADNKFAHISFSSNDAIYNYIISICDETKQDTGMNNIFIHTIKDGKNSFRVAKIIELANLFKATELLRQLFSNWDINDNVSNNTKALNDFLASIKIQEKE